MPASSPTCAWFARAPTPSPELSCWPSAINFADSYSARWRIIGIVGDYNSPIGVGVLLTSLSQANRFDHLPADFVQQVMIRSASRNQHDIDDLAKRVDDTLGGSGIPAFVVRAQQQIQRNQSQFLVLYVLFYSVVVIIALVGAIGLFNALAMSVLERRREIGILRSMGATGGKVAQAFLTEGVALGALAWLVATVVGIPAAYGFVQLLGRLIVQVPFASCQPARDVGFHPGRCLSSQPRPRLGRNSGEGRTDAALRMSDGVCLPA